MKLLLNASSARRSGDTCGCFRLGSTYRSSSHRCRQNSRSCCHSERPEGCNDRLRTGTEKAHKGQTPGHAVQEERKVPETRPGCLCSPLARRTPCLWTGRHPSGRRRRRCSSDRRLHHSRHHSCPRRHRGGAAVGSVRCRR